MMSGSREVELPPPPYHSLLSSSTPPAVSPSSSSQPTLVSDPPPSYYEVVLSSSRRLSPSAPPSQESPSASYAPSPQRSPPDTGTTQRTPVSSYHRHIYGFGPKCSSFLHTVVGNKTGFTSEKWLIVACCLDLNSAFRFLGFWNVNFCFHLWWSTMLMLMVKVKYFIFTASTDNLTDWDGIPWDHWISSDELETICLLRLQQENRLVREEDRGCRARSSDLRPGGGTQWWAKEVQGNPGPEASRPVHPSVERRDDVTVAGNAGVHLPHLHLLRL